MTDMQKRKSEILCTKTKRKRKHTLFPEPMNGYRKEEVWKERGGVSGS